MSKTPLTEVIHFLWAWNSSDTVEQVEAKMGLDPSSTESVDLMEDYGHQYPMLLFKDFDPPPECVMTESEAAKFLAEKEILNMEDWDPVKPGDVVYDLVEADQLVMYMSPTRVLPVIPGDKMRRSSLPEVVRFLSVWNASERVDEVDKKLGLVGAGTDASGRMKDYIRQYPMLLFKRLYRSDDAEPKSEGKNAATSPRPGDLIYRPVRATQWVTYISPTCQLPAIFEEVLDCR